MGSACLVLKNMCDVICFYAMLRNVMRTCISGRASGTFSLNGCDDCISDGASAVGRESGSRALDVDWCEAAGLSVAVVLVAECATGQPPWALTGPAPTAATAPTLDPESFCLPCPPKLIAPIPPIPVRSSPMISFTIDAFFTAIFFWRRLFLLGARVAAWRGPWDSLSMAGSTRSSRSRESS